MSSPFTIFVLAYKDSEVIRGMPCQNMHKIWIFLRMSLQTKEDICGDKQDAENLRLVGSDAFFIDRVVLKGTGKRFQN